MQILPQEKMEGGKSFSLLIIGCILIMRRNKMKKIGKLLSILLVVCIMAVCVAGCNKPGSSSGTGAKSDIKIAVVLKAINSDYWKQVQAGCMAAAKEQGVTVDVLGPNAETDIAGQTAMMEDQITKKVSVLVVAPSQPSAAVATFDKAAAAKVPVILIDTDANWDKKVSFVGTGNEAGGEVGGKFIASKLQKGDEVVIIRGALGDTTHDQRVNGAKKAMEAAGLKVAGIESVNIHDAIKVGLPEREEYIKNYITTLERLGQEGMEAQRDGHLDPVRTCQGAGPEAWGRFYHK
jgi:ABC-type sugar transport system substrate-binding protein